MPFTGGATSPVTMNTPGEDQAQEASNWLNLLNMAQFQPQDTMLQMNPATQMPGPQGMMGSGLNPMPQSGMLDLAGMGPRPEMPNFRGLSQMYRSA